MVRDPCCEKPGLKKGPWTPEEDHKLLTYIQTHGHSSWRALPKQAGLARCGKSCRLRWTNYLRPGIKRGNFSTHEENFIIHLHSLLGNRWSTIATHLPGRTDNEIKNHWNTRLRKRLLKMGIDPMTHRPWPPHHQQSHYIPPPPTRTSTPSIPSFLLALLQQPHASHQAGASPALADPSTLLKSLLLNAAASSSSPPPLSATLAPATATPPLPLPTTFSSTNPPIDPSFLASVETRLILDCLKLSSNSQHEISHSPDHQLNHLITRLLLIKLLQQGTSNAAGSAHHGAALSCPAPPTSMNNNKPPVQQHISEQRVNSTLCGSTDSVLYNQGLQSLMLGGNVSHVQGSGTCAQSASTTFISPDFPAQLSNPSHNGGGIPTSILSNTGNSSYQQRLLQAFPFLAETMFEPCSSNAVADDLSSNQLCHVSAAPPPISSPPSSVSLPSQPPPPLYWPGTTAGLSNTHTMTSGAPLLAGMPATLMAWEELLTKGGEREFNASSSTGNTSSSSTLSSASHAATAAAATPSTPSNNSINVQDYWSNLLNIISPHNNHTHNC